MQLRFYLHLQPKHTTVVIYSHEIDNKTNGMSEIDPIGCEKAFTDGFAKAAL